MTTTYRVYHINPEGRPQWCVVVRSDIVPGPAFYYFDTYEQAIEAYPEAGYDSCRFLLAEFTR